VANDPARPLGPVDRSPGVSFSPDGRTLYSAAGKTVIAWDLTGARRLARPFSFATPDESEFSIGLSPDSATIAVPSGANADRLIFLDIGRLKPVGPTVSPRVGQILGLAFNPAGNIVAVGGDAADGPVLVDRATGAVIRRMKRGHHGGVNSLRFSPDGTRLLSGGFDDGRALIWDVATGRRLGALVQSDGGSVSTAWSPDALRPPPCPSRPTC